MTDSKSSELSIDDLASREAIAAAALPLLASRFELIGAGPDRAVLVVGGALTGVRTNVIDGTEEKIAHVRFHGAYSVDRDFGARLASELKNYFGLDEDDLRRRDAEGPPSAG